MIFSCVVSLKRKKKKIPDLSLPPCISLHKSRKSVVYRAKTIDEQEKALRRRQQEEREKFREEQQLLLKQKEEERRNQIQEKERARTTYKEKMKNATQLDVSIRRCFWRLLSAELGFGSV
jgi:hypothetical protein